MARKRVLKPITIGALALHFRVGRRRVETAIHRGEISAECLSTTPGGVTSIEDGERAKEELGKALEKRTRQGRPPAPPLQIPDGVKLDDPDTWPLDLEVFKAIREYWSARQAKLKTELAAGELVSAEEVRRDNFRAARTARDHLIGITDQVADDIASEFGGDVTGVRRVMRSRIDRVLSDLAKALRAEE